MRVSLLLAYLMISATAAGQGPPAKDDPSPNFRVGTRVVGATIAATRSAKKLGILDWGSTPVGDLRATDLRLFDSDKRQEITSLEKLGQGGAPQAGDSVKGPDNRLSTRTSIILLDALNTSFSDQIYGREGVSRMLSKLPAGHRIAIFAFGGLLHLLHDFSTDYGALRTALGKYEGELPPTGVGNSPFGSRDKATTPGTAASAIHVPGSDMLAAFDQQNRILGTLQALTEIAHSTKNYPGQKNLLWLSGVVPTQFTI
jgi:VWFA-related protein